MGNKISSAEVSTMHSDAYADPTTNTDFYGGGSLSVDGVTGNETSFTTDFDKWHKYYVDVPIFASIIDTLATYAVGKGFKASDEVKKKLSKITGWGKDDFNSIMENLTKVCLTCGDSEAEIIKDKALRLTNLKPVNPGTMKVIVNGNGILKGYEQSVNGKKIGEPFSPKKIFHLCWGRFADEIHGKPYAERVESIIKQIKQLTDDLGLRFHRIVKPVRLYEADTDDETEIANTITKLKQGYENCEFIVVPKGTIEAKDIATIPNAQDAIDYLNLLMRELIISCGVPEVVLGWSIGTTDASAKIVYLSFQQRIERIQKFLEEQIRIQLGIELNFEFPASLEPVTKSAGDVSEPIKTNAPVNNSPTTDNKKAGKMTNIMKK